MERSWVFGLEMTRSVLELRWVAGLVGCRAFLLTKSWSIVTCLAWTKEQTGTFLQQVAGTHAISHVG